jgi:capsular exopolysaccharide synthesis family protein
MDLKLEDRPEFKRRAGGGILSWLRGLSSRDRDSATSTEIAVRILQTHLKAERLGRSALISIGYTAGDGALAAKIANAVASDAAVDDAFHSQLTMSERAGFELLKAWIVSPAIAPLEPSSPDIRIIAVATLLVGVGAAFSAVLMREYQASRTILSADQIARRGIRALALVPDVGAEPGRGQSLVKIFADHDAFTDSIATLLTSLLPLTYQVQSPCMVLLFASALPFEGKSTTVAALGAGIANNGGRVLLVDADLRSPNLHKMFDLNCTHGLSNCLEPEVELDSYVQVDPNTGVALLSAGPHHPRPLEVLGSQRFRMALTGWRKSFDFILIDAPPVLPIADARILVPLSDYCVFVVRWGSTSWEALNQGLRLLIESGARIAGVTVSRVDVKQFATYGFADSSAYGRSYRKYIRSATREPSSTDKGTKFWDNKYYTGLIAPFLGLFLLLAPMPVKADYLLKPGDVLEIKVLGVSEFNRRVAVDAGGQISVPLVGYMEAAGLSLPQLRDKLRDLLVERNIARNPEVLVGVAEYRPVYVSGDVVKPGAYPYRPEMCVRDGIALAEGYDQLHLHGRDPMLEAADARGEYESSAIELAKQTVRVARISVHQNRGGIKASA